MSEKDAMTGKLREEFGSWEELLDGLSEEQLTTRPAPGEMSIKDTMIHLWTWQQLSIARLEAAQANREPEFQLWPADLEPEDEADVDRINAWTYETYGETPWPEVHRMWRDGYLRFLELAEATPEDDLMDEKRYPWLRGYPLYAVLEGSYEHHCEHHYDQIEPMLNRQG